jgi:START domain
MQALGMWWVLLATAWAAPAGWEVISTAEGVEVARKSSPGSPLFAFRGEGMVDAHISKVVGTVLDSGRSHLWVDMLQPMSVVAGSGTNERILYQHYDLPWPVEDRDYVLQQKIVVDESAKMVTITYNSISDTRKPQADCCVRGEVVRTFWKIEPAGPNQTKVIIEVQTDPRGSLPPSVVNLVQKGWPYNTMTGLRRQVATGQSTPDARIASW